MKKKITEKDIINWWLKKYHNTDIDKVLDDNPEWKKYPHKHTANFYKKYQVSQEQHDNWEKWAIDFIAKNKRLSKKYIKKAWWAIYLNTAPNIKNDY